MKKLLVLLAIILASNPVRAEVGMSIPGSGGSSIALTGNANGGPIINVLGTVSLLDDYPLIGTAPTNCVTFPLTCQNTLAQMSLLGAREKAFTLKTAANDTVMLRNMVEFYYPRMQIQVDDSLVVPALTGWHADGYIRRAGSDAGSTASTVCDTTFGAGSLVNRSCPAVIFPPMAHNIGHLDVYASTTGASGDGGSAVYFGKTWQPLQNATTATTLKAAGSGYTVNFAPTIAIATPSGLSGTLSQIIGVSSTQFAAVNQIITDTSTSVIPSNTQVKSFVYDASSHALTSNTTVAAGQAHVNFASGGLACSSGELITDATHAVIPTGTITGTISDTVIGLSQLVTGGGIQIGDTIICYPTITLTAAVTGATVVGDTLNMSDVLNMPQPDASPYTTTKILVTAVDGSGHITGSSIFNSNYGSYSLPLPLQEFEYITSNGWTGATGTVATSAGRGNVFDPLNAGWYMTAGGTGTGAEFAINYNPDFAGSQNVTTSAGTSTSSATLTFAAAPQCIVGYSVSDTTTPTAIAASTTILATGATTATMSANAAGPGVGAGDIIVCKPGADFSGSAYLGANTLFGQVSAQQVGNVSDSTYGSTFGVGFNGLQFVGDTVQVTGGHYGIWIGGSDDFFFTEMNAINSDIGIKFGPGGGGFRGFVTIDSPVQAYLVGDNYEDLHVKAAFLQKYPALYTGSFAIILGEGSSSSSTAQNAGWMLDVDMDQTGTASGIPAMQIANTSGSMFNFNINNYTKGGVLSTTSIVTSYATIDGTGVSRNSYGGQINDSASSLFAYTNSASLDAGSTINVWDAAIGAWDKAPGYVDSVKCGGAGWANTGVGTAEVNNLSIAFPKLHANDALQFSALYSRSGTAADSLSEIVRMCSGACSCTSGAACSGGSSIGSQPSATITTAATRIISGIIYNQNATNAQVAFPVASVGNVTSSGTATTNAIQTSTGGYLNFDSTTVTSSADTDKLQSYCMRIFRNPW